MRHGDATLVTTRERTFPLVGGALCLRSFDAIQAAGQAAIGTTAVGALNPCHSQSAKARCTVRRDSFKFSAILRTLGQQVPSASAAIGLTSFSVNSAIILRIS